MQCHWSRTEDEGTVAMENEAKAVGAMRQSMEGFKADTNAKAAFWLSVAESGAVAPVAVMRTTQRPSLPAPSSWTVPSMEAAPCCWWNVAEAGVQALVPAAWRHCQFEPQSLPEFCIQPASKTVNARTSRTRRMRSGRKTRVKTMPESQGEPNGLQSIEKAGLIVYQK